MSRVTDRLRLVSTLAALATLLTVTAHSASIAHGDAFGGREAAGSARPKHTTSTRWAGYVATTQSGGPFTAVQATWVQPRIRCDRVDSSVAFWIGLGGATARPRGLEQIGTEADCSAELTPSYSAWYELIPQPARPIELPVTIVPGQTLNAELEVDDDTIALSLRNLTTGEKYTAETTAETLDLSSAEWIAEAPSFCLVRCTTLPLADFGTVTFENASTSFARATGPINDPAWTNHRVVLTTAPDEPAALPSRLSADGHSFSVRWHIPRRRALRRR